MKSRLSLTEEKKEKIKKLYSEGIKQPALAERFGVSQATISMLVGIPRKEKEA